MGQVDPRHQQAAKVTGVPPLHGAALVLLNSGRRPRQDGDARVPSLVQRPCDEGESLLVCNRLRGSQAMRLDAMLLNGDDITGHAHQGS